MKVIVCTTDNKPLHPDDIKALEEFMEYRKQRALKKKRKGVKKITPRL